MVGELNIAPAEAARALVDAIMHGKIPHRLEGERMMPPWGCGYSRHPLLSDLCNMPGKRTVVISWQLVEVDWGQGTVSGLMIQVHGPTLVAWMLKEASVLRSLARNAAAPGVSDSTDAGASRGREPGHPAGGAAMEVRGAAPASELNMGSADTKSPSDHRKPFNLRDAEFLMRARMLTWKQNGSREWAPTIKEIEALVKANFTKGWTRDDIRRLAELWPKDLRPRGPRPKRAPARPPNTADLLGGQPRKP